MAADKQSASQDLLADLEKALRRARKLEKVLLKVVAQGEPGPDVESLLKSAQQGVKTLKKEAKKAQRSLTSDTRQVPAQRESAPKSKPQAKTSSKPVRRLRKKEPAPADLPSAEAKTGK